MEQEVDFLAGELGVSLLPVRMVLLVQVVDYTVDEAALAAILECCPDQHLMRNNKADKHRRYVKDIGWKLGQLRREASEQVVLHSLEQGELVGVVLVECLA